MSKIGNHSEIYLQGTPNYHIRRNNCTCLNKRTPLPMRKVKKKNLTLRLGLDVNYFFKANLMNIFLNFSHNFLSAQCAYYVEYGNSDQVSLYPMLKRP